ncbi:hypothetical protein BTO05_09645 [Winogradskyella sp. PC-19]|uniref:hypothetical protein n=1 Tax=unclassified Winogradskyella TaxID=2615021 RepID=UPI000B3CC361|nr:MULTISPECIES: hypothetical protein [unclassified Winogradskyella]ARV09889.1 hypothetical protein BTO05_09645 [Winogradskyella sp. PC-19]RZN84424.1 MAG: hypothetical protein EVB12_00070 [Winogradskyella sp.]
MLKYFEKSQLLSLLLSIILLTSCDGPETYIYLGRQVPKKYIDEIKTLGLLSSNEKIKYFYSDGFNDIKEGLYFVTDKNLVAYNKEWEYPKTIIPFSEITNLDVMYNESLYEDSYIFVESKEFELDFPVSSEKGRDKDFFNYLVQKSNQHKKED